MPLRGFAAASRAAIVASSACAAATPTPGRSRPSAFRNDAPRWSAHCAAKRDGDHRHPDLGRVFGVERKLEACRHHADDGDRIAVERDRRGRRSTGRARTGAPTAPRRSPPSAPRRARRRRRANTRPCIGATPSSGKRSGVTTASGERRRRRRAGQRRRPPVAYAAMRSNAWWPARASRGSRGTRVSSGSLRDRRVDRDEPRARRRTAAA